MQLPSQFFHFLLGASVVGCGGCQPGLSHDPAESSRSVDLDLGTLQPGSRVVGTLRLANPTAEAWRVVELSSSCACLLDSPTSFEVGPGASVPLAVTWDLSSEPEFRGGLIVAIVGKTASGGEIPPARIAVNVLNERSIADFF